MAFARRQVTALIGVAALLAGCAPAVAQSRTTERPPPVSHPASSPSVPATASATPDQPTPSVTPAAAESTPEVVEPSSLDRKASLEVQPVDFGGKGVVIASFGKQAEDLPVQLQRKTSAGWELATAGALDHDGRVEFLVPHSADKFRAVAIAEDGESAASTPTASYKNQWRKDFSDGFSGTSLNTKHWSPRQTGYYIPSRTCSAPYPETIEFEDGSLLGSVVRAGAKRTARVKRDAANASGVRVGKACPHGVWDAFMVSTEGRYSFRYGIAAVRAKFPTEHGVHASVWLQRMDIRGTEIDFIESFGPKYGIQHKVHYEKAGKAVSLGGYVETLPAVGTEEWWDEYHVFSVEWTPREYIFRVDGVETFRTSDGVSRRQEFLIISLLASDWELKRIQPDQMPATMAVDWVQVWQSR